MTPEEWLFTDEGHSWQTMHFPANLHCQNFFTLKKDGPAIGIEDRVPWICRPYQWLVGVDIIPFTEDGGWNLDTDAIYLAHGCTR